MESDGDSVASDYIVETFVRPDKVRAPVNDESADILGNFDDAERTDAPSSQNKSNSTENGHVQMPSHKTVDQALADLSSDAGSGSEDDAGTDPGRVNGGPITENQLEILLRGAKSKRRVLYVTNLNFETTKDDLQTHFSRAGNVKSIRIPRKRRGGYAFIEMETAEGFRQALDLHNSDLHGRRMKVQISEGGKKKSANKKNILKQKNRKLAEMRNETKSFTKSGKNYDKSLKKEKVKEALLRKRWRKPKKMT